MPDAKRYAVDKGVMLDVSFAFHRTRCEQCSAFHFNSPGTLVHLCLEGAILWKRENVVKSKRATIPRDEFYASSKKVKEATRFVE